MVGNKLRNKYLHCSNCASVRSYYIMQAETSLSHDINSNHYYCEFTKETESPYRALAACEQISVPRHL